MTVRIHFILALAFAILATAIAFRWDQETKEEAHRARSSVGATNYVVTVTATINTTARITNANSSLYGYVGTNGRFYASTRPTISIDELDRQYREARLEQLRQDLIELNVLEDK